VDKIELDTNGLTGSFPAEVALLRESLNYLDLYNNLIHNKGDAGNAFLGELTKLEYLYYGTTSFEYDGIPTEIGLLTNLKEYDMSYSLYFGKLEGDMWTNLTNLNYLVMDGNAYNSTLPQELVELPNLEYLYAGFSFLEGDLSFVPQMPKIFELWIDDNPGLSGPIPNDMPNAETLVSMSVTNCGLTGGLPSELGSMTDLIQMWFYDNQLTGTIPTEFGGLVKMKVLNVQKNQLTGEMPAQLCSRRAPFGRLGELEADCDSAITCADTCCTCCGEVCIET
jgi:Leucine-rich repeat (LRR) protein